MLAEGGSGWGLTMFVEGSGWGLPQCWLRAVVGSFTLAFYIICYMFYNISLTITSDNVRLSIM